MYFEIKCVMSENTFLFVQQYLPNLPKINVAQYYDCRASFADMA